MAKHVIDTDLYIDLIRTGNSAPQIDAIYARETAGIYFSSIVAQELLAGVRSPQIGRVVLNLIRPFEKTRRLITPSHRDWKKAGSILAMILVRKPETKTKLQTLVNDCLIAVSARSLGATVYTMNRDDFVLIQTVFPFSLVILH